MRLSEIRRSSAIERARSAAYTQGMINVSDDRAHNAVIVEFKGDVHAAEAKRVLTELGKVLPEHEKGLKVLVDFTSVETIDIEVEDEIKKAMRLFNAQGVSEILRVLPDPAMDIAFDIMSRENYARDMKMRTFRTRADASRALA